MPMINLRRAANLAALFFTLLLQPRKACCLFYSNQCGSNLRRSR
nr:MAG TPA: hypothetical protein [Caudoviricetes sp.]